MAIGRGYRKKKKSRSRFHKSAKRHGGSNGGSGPVKLLHLSPAGGECDAAIVDGSCPVCGWSKP